MAGNCTGVRDGKYFWFHQYYCSTCMSDCSILKQIVIQFHLLPSSHLGFYTSGCTEYNWASGNLARQRWWSQQLFEKTEHCKSLWRPCKFTQYPVLHSYLYVWENRCMWGRLGQKRAKNLKNPLGKMSGFFGWVSTGNRIKFSVSALCFP